MAGSSLVSGTIFFPEVSGAEYLPGDRLLLASDEHGLRFVENASSQLRSGEVKPEKAAALDKKTAKDFPLEDLEDVSFDGQEFAYVLTSHGRNRRGEAEKTRYRLGRLRVKDDGLAKPLHSDGLWWAILAELPALAEASLRTPARGGLNIEGLAYHPAGHLLVGLRSPTMTRAKKRKSKCQEDAVVLRVGDLKDLFGDDPDEPASLVAGFEGETSPDADGAGDESAAEAGLCGKAALLDLDGQGVRGLCYDRQRDACWILSGLSADPNHDVQQPWGLWLWEGARGDPRRVELPPDARLTGPEAICLVPIGGKPHLLIIEDSTVAPHLLGPDDEVDVQRLKENGAGSRYVLLPAEGLGRGSAVTEGLG